MTRRQIPISGGEAAVHRDRDCVRFGEDAPILVTQGNVQFMDGTVEIDLAVTGERSFPGLAWRVDGDTYESFFVRPHQAGNPDACQYTPVFNGVSGWQLYHGAGFWSPISFAVGEWFKVRVCFAGDRGEAYVGDMEQPALVFDRLRIPARPGRVGILPGGAGTLFTQLTYDQAVPALRGPTRPPDQRQPGVVPGWLVSNLVPEGVPITSARTWAYLETEATGLANLARVHPLGERLNTVFARAIIRAANPGIRAMEIGFSDRAIVFLNGRALFAGRDDYRSRDYRFLGSIGWWDRLFVPLEAGDNELVVAVSETFGGWGLQARFTDPAGLSFSTDSVGQR